MFRIKICGVTNSADAATAIAAGADALGLNFYPASKRYIDQASARQIAEVIPPSVAKVCVFVNHSPHEIAATVANLNPTFIQLHGDEPPELLADLPRSVGVVRAYRCGAPGLAPLALYLEQCETSGRAPDAVLIDADAVGAFGGTGHAADWHTVARDRTLLGAIPLILAGGLTPANVAAAIKAVRPDAVDVASGVETSPGKKDRSLVDQFVSSARSAFAVL